MHRASNRDTAVQSSKRVAMEVLGAIEHRVRLYSALLAGCAVHAGTQLYRAITRQQHPLQWPAGQEWSVSMMKTLFTVGRYNHWRNFIKASLLLLLLSSTGQISEQLGVRFKVAVGECAWQASTAVATTRC